MAVSEPAIHSIVVSRRSRGGGAAHEGLCGSAGMATCAGRPLGRAHIHEDAMDTEEGRMKGLTHDL